MLAESAPFLELPTLHLYLALYIVLDEIHSNLPNITPVATKVHVIIENSVAYNIVE